MLRPLETYILSITIATKKVFNFQKTNKTLALEVAQIVNPQ